MKKKILFLFAATITVVNFAVSQDTIRLSDTSHKHAWIVNHTSRLDNKFIECDGNSGSYIFELLSCIPGATRKDCNVNIPESFGLVHNTFFKGHILNPGICQPQSIRIVVPQSAHINFSRFYVPLEIGMTAQNIYFLNDTLNEFSLISTNSNSIQIGNCVCESDIWLRNIHSDGLGVYSDSFTNRSKPYNFISLSNSNIGTFACSNNLCPSLSMFISADTFTKSFEVKETFISGGNTPSSRQIFISDCHIDSRFFLDSLRGNSFSTVSFRSCTLGKNAALTIVAADTIEFVNCLNIVDEIPLVINNTKKTTYLKISNSNISNLKFDYLGDVKLYIWEDNDELNKSNYENLISKFEKDKKEESLKNLKIEYYKFSHCSFVCFISRVWWYYGYRRELVFIWTSGFLLIFTCINLIFWDRLKSTYPIIEAEPDLAPEYRDPPKQICRRHLIMVLTFTAMIFFSLKVDFQKLSFKSPGMVVYFFTQYIFGLGCLFFILNFILKF